MFDKNFFGILSLVVSIAGYAPYVISVFKGRTKPHAFTWMTWTISVTLAFVAQLSRGAGHGAWVTGCAVVACFGISALALKYGEKNVTRGDELVFGITLAAIPLWVITREPMWSVWLMVLINNLGFIPTFRKTYSDPHGENVPFFVSVVVKFLLGIAALDHYSLVTVLYPLNCAVVNAAFLAMMLWRRKTFVEERVRNPALPTEQAALS